MNTIYKLRYTTKEGEEGLFSAKQINPNTWIYMSELLMLWHSVELKVILGIAQAIRNKEGITIHKDTIKEIEI